MISVNFVSVLWLPQRRYLPPLGLGFAAAIIVLEDMNKCITHMHGLSGDSRAGPKPVHSGFSKDKSKWFGFLSCKGLGLRSRSP